MEKKRSSFSGKLGFVLSAAGASVGLGNIWRFPYLAAKYGGGIFLVIYILLALTFGYTMIMAETTLGRMTKKSPVGAFLAWDKEEPGEKKQGTVQNGKYVGTVKAARKSGRRKWLAFGGWMNSIIPLLIVQYYSVIGGWVAKYLVSYFYQSADTIAQDGYFSNFISSGVSAEFWFLVFSIATIVVIFMGVQNGIERVSRIMMPVLIVLAFIIAIYSMTRPGAGAGILYFLVPSVERFSWMTVVTAMGQMFYSLSIAMGILITFGSYMKRNVSIEGTTRQVEFFDTLIAMLAGLMIIPAVFAFYGADAGNTLQAGPSLMFITMPKVFASMGFGRPIGITFFLLVLFAALTSSIALAEAAVSTLEDELGWSRRKSTLAVGAVMLALGTLSALGYGPLSGVTVIGMQFLDFFDFITNSVMMPIAALCTCLLVTRVIGLQAIADEVEYDGAGFRRRKIFNVMIKWLCPVFVMIILVSSVANVLGVITM